MDPNANTDATPPADAGAAPAAGDAPVETPAPETPAPAPEAPAPEVPAEGGQVVTPTEPSAAPEAPANPGDANPAA
jgi:hypothetical protein